MSIFDFAYKMHLFSKKYIRQFEANIFTMTKSVYISQNIAGIVSIEFEKPIDSKSKRLRVLINVWNAIALSLLLVGSLQSLLVIMGKSVDKLLFIIYLLQFGPCLYRSLWLRYQRKEIYEMMVNIQNCIIHFPNAVLREHRYIKMCLFAWTYITLQSIDAIENSLLNFTIT
jgi:hypothetical protein